MEPDQDQTPPEDVASKAVNIAVDPVAEMICPHCGQAMAVEGLDAFIPVECPHCHAAATVPARLGSFLLLDLIGAGGMGGVYHAKDETLNRFVAIKVMLKSLGDDEQFVETFRREAQSVAKLNHPNIVQIYSFGQEKGQPYIVMELVKGERLDKMMAGGKPLGQAFVMQVAYEVAQGLQAADEAGLVHGDVKPENILLDEKMSAKVVDFGLASYSHQAAEEGIWGTPYYIAPEKLRRQKVDARADIYSLGATIFHALAGKPPFEGETAVDVVKARLEQPPPELNTVRPDADPRVVSIVTRMLEPDPARRYPTYASLLSDLKALLPALKEKEGPPAPSKGRKVIIRKKGGAARPASEAAETPEGVGEILDEKPEKPHKLVVHKSSTLVVPTARPPGETAEAAAGEGEGGGRKWLKWVWIGVGALALLAVAGFGIASCVSHRGKKQAAAEQARVAHSLGQAKTLAEELVGKIRLAADKIADAEKSARPHFELAAAALKAVTDQTLPYPELEPETPPVATQAVAAVANPAITASNAPPAAATNAPAGAVTNAPAATNAAATATAATNVVAAAAAPPPEPAAPAIEEETADMPPIKRTALRVARGCRSLAMATRRARRDRDTAEFANKEVQGAFLKSTADPHLATLNTILTNMERLQPQVEDALKAIAKSAQDADRIRQDTEKDRAQKRQVEAAAEAKRKAEEASRQAEEAKVALTKTEVQRAGLARADVQTPFKANDFKACAEALKGKLDDYKTDDGRKAMKAVIQRYTMLEDMRQFFIEQLSAAPLRWGWVQGPAEDITGATDKGIHVRRGVVPWSELTPRQMHTFISRYLEDPKAGASVKLRRLADLNLAASVYYFENGKTDLAVRYAKQAVQLLPTIKDEAELVLPEEVGHQL